MAQNTYQSTYQTLCLIHTSPTLTPMFSALCAEQMPDVKLFHMVDESLIKETIRAGRLERLTMRRVLGMIELAERGGADAVLVTCSSIGPGVAMGQQLFDIPVVRVDEAMAEAAVKMGSRIGVMATLKTTLEPTIALLQEKAHAAGKTVEIVGDLCEGAFDAVLAGDTGTHDAILTASLMGMKDVDLIVLAQASMARVVNTLPHGALAAPVLSSPALAVSHTKTVLADMASRLKG